MTELSINSMENMGFYFGTYIDAFYSMWALQTSTSFPGIMLRIYPDTRVYSVFFILYLFVQYYLLLNMIAGVYYFNYKKFHSILLLAVVDSKLKFR